MNHDGTGIVDALRPLLCPDCDVPPNGVPDLCETYEDINGGLIPDSCQAPDCDIDGASDVLEILRGEHADCNYNWIPDDCEDCNGNGLADECDLVERRSSDCDENGIPDECDTTPFRVYVDADATGTPDGSGWHDAYHDLQSALDQWVDDCTPMEVWVARSDEPYVPSARTWGNEPRSATFTLRKNMRIYGGFEGEDSAAHAGGETAREQRAPDTNVTVLSGDLEGNDSSGDKSDNCWHVVTADRVDPTAVLDGFTITGGYAVNTYGWYGGGLCCQGGSPTIVHCAILGNEACVGAGVACVGSSPWISYCTIQNNTAGYAGAMICMWGVPGDVPGDRVRLLNCVISDNTAQVEDREVCDLPGAIGGAIVCESTPMQVVNCTFANNSADVGRALACVDGGEGISYVTMESTILWDGGDEVDNQDASEITITYGDVQDGWTGPGGENLGADPQDDPLFVVGDPTYHLSTASPCIDTGHPYSVLAPSDKDIDGDPRVLRCRIDMGADEYAAPCVSPTVTSVTPDADMQGETVSDVSIVGTNFAMCNAGTTVKLRMDNQPDIVASEVHVSSETQLTCRFDLTGAVVGNWDVVVTTCASGTLIGGFEVCASPMVTSITPAAGCSDQTLEDVAIVGTNFASGAGVKLTKSGETDIVATDITFVDSTHITCSITVPAGAAAGLWDVVVTTCASGTLAEGFHVCAPPTVTDICPKTGVQGTGNRTENTPGPSTPLYTVAAGPVHATIAGTNFAAGATVKLVQSGKDDLVATNVVVVDPTTITADIDLGTDADPVGPPGSLDGTWDVVVTTCAEGTLSGAFTVSMCFTPAVDTDGDADVDLMDFSEFRSCFNGDNKPYQSGGGARICACVDYDTKVGRDGDVDLLDFATFRNCFNGSNRPPVCPGNTGVPGCTLSSASPSPQPEAMVTQAATMDTLEGVDVTFALASPQAGQTITAGTYVEWHSSVSLTGESQGLGGWDFSLFLGPNTGPTPGSDGIWGTDDDGNLSNITLDVAGWSEAYAVTGANGKPTTGADLTAAGNLGGPGMDVMTSDGINDKPGTLLQVGASHLTWSPWRYVSTGKNPGWYGEHTWGVGLDDRKEALLLNTSGSFELNVGWIDTTNLAPGHYVLTLVSSGLIDVLRPDADLSVSQSGGILAPASSVNGPVSIEFDIDE